MDARENWSVCSIGAVVSMLAGAALGDQLHVPGDYPTIQQAIVAGTSGDEVVVAPGTYSEALDLLGKEIAVRASGGPAVTTLDGSGLGAPIVLCVSGETLGTVIEGFTFRDGEGSSRRNCYTQSGSGGAIYITFSSLTVRGCEFVENAVDRGISAGGAICTYMGGLRVEACTFLDNGGYTSDPDNAVGYGGAINACSDRPEDVLEIVDSLFSGNGPSGHGGAVLADMAGPVSISGSTFEGNDSSHGGGLSLEVQSSLTLSDCEFLGNSAAFGGGVNVRVKINWMFPGPTVALIERCTFDGNTTGFGGGMFASAFRSFDNPEFTPELHVVDCRFTANTALGCCNVGVYQDECRRDGSGKNFGGAADLRTIYGGLIEVVNCEAVGNEAKFGGGFHLGTCGGGDIRVINSTIAENGPTGVHVRHDEADSFQDLSSIGIHNTISWANGVAPTDNLLIESDGGPFLSSAVSFSDIGGGAAGEGNIDADPLFRDPAGGDYRLGSGSPSIDAADNTAVPVGTALDLAGDPRFVDDPATSNTGVPGGEGGDSIVDMGAYEFQGCRADVNGDGVLDTRDFVMFLNAWAHRDPLADWNGDGTIDTRDFVAYLDEWAAGC